MSAIDNINLGLLSGGVYPSFSHSLSEPQAGAKEEFAIGFLRAAGAFLFKVIVDVFTRRSDPKKANDI